MGKQQVWADVAQVVLAKASGLEKGVNSVVRPIGLASAHWFVLHQLMRTESATMSELSVATGTPAPTMTRLVDKLIEHSYVYRAVDGDDRRRTLVRISPRGRDLVREWSPAVSQALGEQLEGLSDWELLAMQQVLKG